MWTFYASISDNNGNVSLFIFILLSTVVLLIFSKLEVSNDTEKEKSDLQSWDIARQMRDVLSAIACALFKVSLLFTDCNAHIPRQYTAHYVPSANFTSFGQDEASIELSQCQLWFMAILFSCNTFQVNRLRADAAEQVAPICIGDNSWYGATAPEAFSTQRMQIHPFIDPVHRNSAAWT